MAEPCDALVCGLGAIGCALDFDAAPGEDARTHALALARHPSVRLRGGCDPDPARRAAFTRHFGAPAYATLEEALEKVRPGLVSVCSPTPLHFPQTMSCMEAGVPMVWLEKPPATGLEELERLAQASPPPGASTAVLVNYHRRFAANCLRLRRFCRDGELGRLVRLDAVYSRGLAVNGCHMVDLAFFLAGDPPGAELTGKTGADPENPSFFLRFPSGLEASFVGVAGLAYHCIDLAATFEDGRATLAHGGMTVRLERRVEHELFPGYYRLREEPPPPDWTGGFHRAFENALDDLLNAHETGTAPLSTPRTALPTQAVLERALAPGPCGTRL